MASSSTCRILFVHRTPPGLYLTLGVLLSSLITSLSTFRASRPQCTIKNLDLCDDETKAQIQKYQGMSKEDLSAAAEEEEGKMQAAEKNFEAEVEKLQAQYEKLSKEKDEAIAEIKAAGLGLLKSVLRSKEAPEQKDEL